MKFVSIVILWATLLACDSPKKETEPDPQVAVNVMNDYVANCNAMKDAGKWVANHQLLTEAFKKDYQKMMKEAWEADPDLGLGFDPIFNAQDYPEKGFELASERPSKNKVITLQGIEWKDFSAKVRLVEVNGKYLVDGIGAVRMPK